MKTIAISGGFDPVHSGHIDLIQSAMSYGKVIVYLNSDEWLLRKKGYFFMNWECRAKILLAMEGVYSVIRVDDSDGAVCEALQRLKPDFFANGGDRTEDNTPELDICKKLGITALFNVGGGKTHSSSEIVNAIRKA